MNMKIQLLLVILIQSFLSGAQNKYLVSNFRAAPGKLLNLIELLKSDTDNNIMRHSQGDHWDLMVIKPVKDYSEVASARVLGTQLEPLVAYREDMFASGSSHSEFKTRFNKFSYYHIEMFVALAGKHGELLKEREMENVYLKEIERDDNLIFIKDLGSKYDMFTIGFYRDIKHYAESADIPLDKEDAAAKKAGFKGVNSIGIYLRELISEHHDTLAVKVK